MNIENDKENGTDEVDVKAILPLFILITGENAANDKQTNIILQSTIQPQLSRENLTTELVRQYESTEEQAQQSLLQLQTSIEE